MAERRFNWLLLLPPAITLGLGYIAWAALMVPSAEREQLPSALIGKPAPAVAEAPLGDLNQATDEMLRAEGVKLVNFWASWCGPCRIEHPILTDLAAEGLPIIGINYKDQPDAALGFLDELGDPYIRIGADTTGRVAIEWGVYGLPETFVIDAEGRIAYKHIGPFDHQTLEEDILPVVERLRAGASQ